MMTTKNYISAVIIFAAAILLSCNAHSNNNVPVAANQPAKKDSVSVYTFPVNNGFGYTIFINNKAFIKQDCIPAIQGNKPFASKEDAKKTGSLVAAKIRNNELPTLTIAELNSIGIIQ